MGCKHKKHNYSRIMIDDDNDGVSINNLRNQGNKSISGLMHRCVAVKRRGCKK